MTAGGTAAFVAIGDGLSGNDAGSGNVTVAGSKVNANDVILAAKNQVNLVSTTDTDSTRSTNQSSSASVGVSLGTQGFGVDASMSKAHGDGNSDAAMQNNSHVTAANTATIISGGDTNIIGSNVSGAQVNAYVGGNLNVASIQDTTTSATHQQSSGGGFSISQGGGSASFSTSHGNANGGYAGVNEQAGIHAGSDGFNINVHGNTDLKGAMIASEADASKNNLSTGTITVSDIQNQSNYNAHSGGFSAGATTGDGGANYSTHGPASTTNGPNAGGGAPTLSQNDSGSDSAATRSGISAGTISVTDAAHQTQDVASVNRDTSNTNGTVSKLPDMNNLLDRQSDMMAAASAAGEVVSRRIGDYADARATATGDPGWADGGAYRAEMQAAGAALVTGLAGGNAIGGAAGAGIASIAGGKLNDLSGAIAGSNPTGSSDINAALGNIVANAIATGAGAVVGGNAGAFEGYNVDRYNRQLHPEEKTLAKQIADKSGGKYTEAQVEDQMRLMGATINGKTEAGAPDTLIGQAPTDAGASWQYAGKTADGKPILTQVNATVNPELQNYIRDNYASVGAGVPSLVTGYVPTPTQPKLGQTTGTTSAAGTVCPHGDCGIAVYGPSKNQVADAASSISTAAGRTGAAMGAAAQLPTPYAGAFASAAYASTVVGWVAGGVEQLTRPNARPYISGGLVDIGNYFVSDRYPMAGPVITEVGEAIKGSSWMDQFNKGTKK